MEGHDVPVYLINTGWTGGPYGVGSRISLPTTRAIIDACIRGDLKKTKFKAIPRFHLSIPEACPGVPAEILNPSQTWRDRQAYEAQAEKLSQLFEQNFRKFA